MTVAPTTEGCNPAVLAPELADLYPPGVAAAQLSGAPPEGCLTESEYQSIRHCASKRINDFTAGRLCVRRALAEFGVSGMSLPLRAGGPPKWPEPLTGSITHTHGYSAAVVCRGDRLRGIGVDSEQIDSVHAELWPRICTLGELAQLSRLDPDGRARTAALIFTAKEAFYKCQFPLTGEWIEFEEVTIECGDWAAQAGSYVVQPRRALRLQQAFPGRIEGRFRRHEPYVTSAVALAA